MDSAGRIFVVDSLNNRVRVLTPSATVTSVTGISPEPSVTGQAYTVAFMVQAAPPGTGTPTGDVIVSNGSQTCTATVAQGSCALTSLTASLKTITVTYGGDENFTGSMASSIHTVDKANSTTTITTDLSAATVVGQSYTVAFTVVVNSPGSGTPTGDVVVSDGSQSCTSGVAAGSCVLTSLTAGSKTITATYAGDSDFNASVSPGVSHPVAEAAPVPPSNVDAVVAVNVNKRITVYTGTVTWVDSSDNETGFLIRRFSNASGACIVEAGFSAATGAGTTTYTDAAANATTCGYGVASTNAGGTSAYIDDTNVTPTAAPTAPTDVNAVMTTATKGKNVDYRAAITWTDTSTNAASFLVRRYITSGSGCVVDTDFGTVVLSARKGSYTDSKASAATCAYAVAAANSGGASAYVGDRDLTGGIQPF